MPDVYIIDDERAIAELLGIYIENIQLEAHTYTSAKEFFDNEAVIDNNSILILDLKMPDMDGIEVIRLLAKKNMTLSLILVSGYDTSVLHSAKQLAQAHNFNVIGSLVKPIDRLALEQFVLSHTPSEVHISLPGASSDQVFIPQLDDIKLALEQEQLVLHFQPQINLETGEVIGAEALVRWLHPQHGLIFPDKFIAMIENNGLMDLMTKQVINLAIQQISYLVEHGRRIPLSVNVSAENINSLSLPEYLTCILQDNKLDPTMLILEITETALMGELVTSLDILTRLRMKGFDLSIDDFGTGYSSLSHLHRIPFTELKIDQSFVKTMAHDDVSNAIIRTCILLGHELGMSVVAEGVESKPILERLINMGCDNAQGYHIARPMPAEQLLQWLEEH